MLSDRSADHAELVSDLNDLIQLDRDATEAYTVAINSVRAQQLADTLVVNRGHHQRHVEELAALVRARGALAIEMPHITGPFKMAVQAMGGLTMRDENVLFALRVVEGQVREKYAHYADRKWPADVEPVIRRNANDEQQHYRWVLDELNTRGYGADSMAGTFSAMAEAVHKMVATPLESMSKQIMRTFDDKLPWSPSSWLAKADTIEESSAANVHSFRNALRALEETGDVEWMVSLFASDATLSGPLRADTLHGLEGAHRFWMAYRGAFTQVHTTLDQQTPSANLVTIQWTTEGLTRAGAAAVLRGVTMLEYRGTRITKLQMFFDPTPLGNTTAHAPSASEPDHATSGSA